MPFNPFEEKPIPIEMTYMDWKTMYPKPYNKETADPYTKCRVVLMNGTEFEAQWFSRNFSRHCPDNDLRRSLAMMRRTEQQQQKRISCLKPKDETILEHTITYEQLAVDLTARLAQKETDCNVRNTMNFALLEDLTISTAIPTFWKWNITGMRKSLWADTRKSYRQDPPSLNTAAQRTVSIHISTKRLPPLLSFRLILLWPPNSRR